MADPIALCVNPAYVQQIWPHVAGMLEPAMRRTKLGSFEVMQRDLFQGDALLWLAWREPEIEGSAVTRIVQTEYTKVCVIVACGGRRVKRWLPLIGVIETYAEELGCERMRIFGRTGWLRLLKNYSAPMAILERRF